MDCSPPGSSVHGILQARILGWVVIPFSRGSSWPRDQAQVSHTAGRFFTVWATSEAQFIYIWIYIHYTHTLFFRFFSLRNNWKILRPVPGAVGYLCWSSISYIIMCHYTCLYYTWLWLILFFLSLCSSFLIGHLFPLFSILSFENLTFYRQNPPFHSMKSVKGK